MTRISVIDTCLNAGRRFGRPDILFWTLPWLMILVVMGTIDQKYIGLYEAQNRYFSSFIWWFYGIPLPAGYSVLSVLTLNMTCKFCFLSDWTRDRVGIHLTHFSIIVLMVGGLLTALTMNEGYLALKTGQSGTQIQDYHARVLVFEQDGKTPLQIPFDHVESATDLPFEMKVLRHCVNTAIRPRKDIGENKGVGAASMAEIVCVKPRIENERNVAGLFYQVGESEYIVFEGRETQDEIDGYTIRLDRATRDLPFEVSLQSFRRDVYPGTNRPREYESRVTITDGDVVWPARIAMNEPLRYGGYTFYQASTLVDRDGQAVSVLSVVKNTGWLFPYISGILMAIGLIWHLIVRLRGKES